MKVVNQIFCIVLLAIMPVAIAQNVISDDIRGIEIADGVHLLTGLSCNTIAVVGPDGVLMVDNGSVSDSKHLEKLIAQFDTGPVRFVLNTHFHFDHIGGNEVLAKKGAVIIAHKNGRLRMKVEWRFPEALGLGMPLVSPYPEVALPKLTFTDTLTVHFGGHRIEALHLPSAHSDADLAVFLRDANVLHTGDLYLSNGFPLTDALHGGTINGTIAAIGELIGLIDDDTKVVPGHGPISNRQELRVFQQMLEVSRDRIAMLIADGKTLEEVIAANPTAGLYTRGRSWIYEELFVRLVYADLAWSNTPATAKESDSIYPAEESE
jgi:cyclase